MKKITNYSHISSPFGERVHPITEKKTFHNGLDLAVPVGTQVFAPFDGVVAAVYYHPSGGQTVILRGKNEDRAGFCHLNDTLLDAGAKVKKGQCFAKSGNSGKSTGAHLHFTYAEAKYVNWSKPNGAVKPWQDPTPYLIIND